MEVSQAMGVLEEAPKAMLAAEAPLSLPKAITAQLAVALGV
jgi:hypothetical protein